MKNYKNLSWDDIKAMYAETSRQIKENAKQFKENAKQFKETDRRMAKMNAEANQSREELRQELKDLAKMVGGIGHNNGEMAEEFFYNTFKRDKTFANEKFDHIKKNFTYRGVDDNLKAEYDIFLFNGTSAAIIEVKYNAKAENIEIEKLISRIDVFKIWFPEYKNHKIYLGVAAMSFNKNIVWQLHRAGIATIRPVGKKMVVYDKTVKAF